MTLVDLLSLTLTHLVSGLDNPNSLHDLHHEPITSITGHTEWVVAQPEVSIGWCWRLEPAPCNRITAVRVGLPMCNVMLVDALSKRDYGWSRNDHALATVVDSMPWAEQTLLALEFPSTLVAAQSPR